MKNNFALIICTTLLFNSFISISQNIEKQDSAKLNDDYSLWSIETDETSDMAGYLAKPGYYFQYIIGDQSTSYANAIVTLTEKDSLNYNFSFLTSLDSIEVRYASTDYLIVIMPSVFTIDLDYGNQTLLPPSLVDTTVMIYVYDIAIKKSPGDTIFQMGLEPYPDNSAGSVQGEFFINDIVFYGNTTISVGLNKIENNTTHIFTESNQLFIQSATSGDSKIEIYNVAGQILYQKEISLHEGINTLPILQEISQDLIFVRLSNGSQITTKKLFIH